MMEKSDAIPSFCTVGHGDRDAHALQRLLLEGGVRTLVDIRTLPRSKRYPQFDETALRTACETSGIAYHWAGRQLGGLRNARADSPHVALPEGLRGFADHADAPVFEHALVRLEGLARQGPVALLCAERDPMQCHRSLIADRLLLRGHSVVHLLEPGPSVAHALRPEACVTEVGPVYDRGATASFDL
jgi:uncharacterized protein (DUF488 family)